CRASYGANLCAHRPSCSPRPRHAPYAGHCGRSSRGPPSDRGLSWRRRFGDPIVTILELQEVSAWYGRYAALEGISLTVGVGQAIGVLGANGSGKTTTLRAISGMVHT